jgi:hypothetical protein
MATFCASSDWYAKTNVKEHIKPRKHNSQGAELLYIERSPQIFKNQLIRARQPAREAGIEKASIQV